MVQAADRSLPEPSLSTPQKLGLTEAAAYLAIDETDVARLVRLGEIAAAGGTGQLVFTTHDLDAYLLRKSQMTQWEYLFIEVVEEKRLPRPWTINGEEIPGWKNGPSIYAFTDDLGREGWELVGAPGNSKGALVGLVFKRPRRGP